MLIFLYLIFFVVLYLLHKRYKSPILNFVLLFYIFQSICGIYVHYFIEDDTYCTITSLIFHIFIIYLFIKPIIQYGKNECVRNFIHPSSSSFKTISYIFIGLQIFSILFFAGYVFKLLMYGNLGAVRNNLLSGGDLNLGASLFRTIAGTASYYYCFNILFFFYSLAFRKDKKIFLYLLMLSSSSRIFHSLTYMGRDGLLFWLFSFFSCYYIFKPYFTKKSKKLIKNVFITVGSFAVVIFIMISIDRFGSDSNSEISTIDSIINYNGQAIDNFGRLYDRYTPESPVFSKLFELFGERDKLRGIEAVRRSEEFEFRFGFRSNIFSSFVGSFYSALGSICTILISFIYSLFIGRMLDKKNVNMNTLIILMISTQIVLHNYYYWAYYIRVANFFILTIPLICLYFSQTNKRS